MADTLLLHSGRLSDGVDVVETKIVFVKTITLSRRSAFSPNFWTGTRFQVLHTSQEIPETKTDSTPLKRRAMHTYILQSRERGKDGGLICSTASQPD